MRLMSIEKRTALHSVPLPNYLAGESRNDFSIGSHETRKFDLFQSNIHYSSASMIHNIERLRALRRLLPHFLLHFCPTVLFRLSTVTTAAYKGISPTIVRAQNPMNTTKSKLTQKNCKNFQEEKRWKKEPENEPLKADARKCINGKMYLVICWCIYDVLLKNSVWYWIYTFFAAYSPLQYSSFQHSSAD